MLNWVFSFLVIAVIAALLGFSGIAVASAEIAKMIFFVFLVLFVISSVFYMTGATFTLLSWVITFFVISVVAALLGFSGMAIVSGEIARVTFIVFLVLFAISLIAHLAKKLR